jgi:ankyrin repeat protein
LYTAANGHKEIVQELLSTGNVDPDSTATSDNDRGRTPLSYTAANDHLDVVRLLLKTSEVDADSKDNKSRTPLL